MTRNKDEKSLLNGQLKGLNSRHINLVMISKNPLYKSDLKDEIEKVLTEIKEVKTKLYSKELTDQEKLNFIVETESRILSAIMKGHRASDSDEFHEDRKLMNQYRIELKLIKK